MNGGVKTTVTVENGIMTAVINGEIDHHTARDVRETIDRAFYLYRPSTLYLDLGQVTFMDSSGLGLILGRVAVAANIGGQVILCHIPPRVMKILDMAGVARIPGLTLA